MLDFFEQQQRAVRRTRLLVVLYIIGVAVVTLATVPPVMFLAAGFLRGRGRSSRSPELSWDWLFFHPEGQLLLGVSCAVAACIVVGASAYKYLHLRGGGETVATELGGRRVASNSIDPDERRLLNVVEEMALASGVPVPPVYVMPEEGGINAFAAGFSPSDAVIGVTRGAIQGLTREQLQGVIAHEFSHILNGDMRLGVRMIALLYGILAVQMMGYILMRARGRNALGVILAGVAMVVVGYVGGLVAQMIKAMVSRQREYLADASAVQFTRDPAGLSGALRVIGAGRGKGVLVAANAQECSHLYFVQGVSGFLDGLFSTHPPVEDRVRRLDPQWDGTWLKRREGPPPGAPKVDRAAIPLAPLAAVAAMGLAEAAAMPAGRSAPRSLGADEVFERMVAARKLLDGAPRMLMEAAHDPWEAQALVLGMLLDGKAEVRARQLEAAAMLGDAVASRAEKLYAILRGEDRALRLPLLDVSLASLSSMSLAQYHAFRVTAEKLIHADKRVSLFEWCLERLLVVHLDRRFVRARPVAVQYYKLTRLKTECGLVLSAVAWSGSTDAGVARAAFDRASAVLGYTDLALAEKSISLTDLEGALATLATVTPALQRHLTQACAAGVGADSQIRPEEMELLRAIADTLGVVMGTGKGG